MQRNDHIGEITPGDSMPWHAGIFAIEHKPTGRRYYVASRCIGKRVWDNLNWLKLGTHKNGELQRHWTSHPADFRLVLVDRMRVEGLLGFVKQARIDADRAVPEMTPYNLRNATPTSPTRQRPAGPPLPATSACEPSPAHRENAYDRILRAFVEDAVDRPAQTPAQMRARAERTIASVRRLLEDVT